VHNGKLNTNILKLAFVFVLFTIVPGRAQLTPWLQWTFIPEEYMQEIIGEASGENAWNMVVETGGYNRDRHEEEYAGLFYETQYFYKKLKEYNLPGAKVIQFPGSEEWDYTSGQHWEAKLWDGIRGELWEIKPLRQKLASYQDVTAMLVKGSNSANVQAELVWIGAGGREDLEGKSVAGKIVVTEGDVFDVHKLACMEMGASGLISMYSQKPHFDPLQIPFPRRYIEGYEGAPAKFAFYIPPREGMYLKKRLLTGEKITVRAQVESKMRGYTVQDIVCQIPGTEPERESVIFSAHLFEWYTKQGANDNKSGCAVLLEIARVLKKLIDEGRIPRPKRNIRFLWGQEYKGTGMWARANRDLLEKVLCNINLDMVGSRQTMNKSFLCLFRTSYGNPHYVNDVIENYFRFVGEGNRDKLHNLWSQNVYNYSQRIVAPSGSNDPFYYSIEPMFKGSDSEVFNDWGVRVPGAFINAWPDQWYHTSGDRPDKLDATALKRIVVIGAASAYTIANADDNMAIKIAGEISSNAARRLGHQYVRGLVELNRAGEDSLAEAYRTAVMYVDTAAKNERQTLETVLELGTDKDRVLGYIEKAQYTIDKIVRAQISMLKAHMHEKAVSLDIPSVKIELSDLEKTASQIIPKPTANVMLKGYLGYNEFIQKVPAKDKIKNPFNEIADVRELHLLINGINSALDIKDMLDSQYPTKSDLGHIMNYLEILRIAGLIEM